MGSNPTASARETPLIGAGFSYLRSEIRNLTLTRLRPTANNRCSVASLLTNPTASARETRSFRAGFTVCARWYSLPVADAIGATAQQCSLPIPPLPPLGNNTNSENEFVLFFSVDYFGLDTSASTAKPRTNPPTPSSNAISPPTARPSASRPRPTPSPNSPAAPATIPQ